MSSCWTTIWSDLQTCHSLLCQTISLRISNFIRYDLHILSEIVSWCCEQFCDIMVNSFSVNESSTASEKNNNNADALWKCKTLAVSTSQLFTADINRTAFTACLHLTPLTCDTVAWNADGGQEVLFHSSLIMPMFLLCLCFFKLIQLRNQ